MSPLLHQWGNTALLLAISMDYVDTTRVLLKSKANILAKNKVGKLDLWMMMMCAACIHL